MLVAETCGEALRGFAENEQLVEDSGLRLEIGQERGLVLPPAKLQGQARGTQDIE